MNKTQIVRGLATYAVFGFAVFGASYTANKLGVPKYWHGIATGAGLVALYKNKHFENALFGPAPTATDFEEETEVAEVKDLTPEEVAQIKDLVGGDEGYDRLMLFTKEHAPENVIEAYDNVVSSGDVEAISEMLQGLDAARTRILASADNTPDTVGELIVRNDHGVV